MKKTLIIALAGMMLFAFTQCGGGGGKEDTKGTKQYTETMAAFEELEKMVNDASTCEELEEAGLAVAFGGLAIAFGDDEYAEGEKLTEKEQKKLTDYLEKLSKDVEKKTEKLGCKQDEE